ncbi:SusC/RagA family TonB-linked outer membrane protein [Saccharicrinis aurantiacus]|uniref:SusC/RagA family TonB-linked outer membrane protein n=1 Tax=Saccharicrinis aurantiacus TaxID=1849719 RepID=UPI00248FB38B|nr:TonB-dependent receptor [Saccharicrinis aurantiacus]
MKRMKTNAWRVLLVLAVLFSMNSVSVLAQNLEITGVVSDGETGDPIPGVSVYIVGTTNGTITNIDGQYNISAASDAQLGFSFIGYQTKSVDVAGKTSLSVSLAPDVVSLDEVVAVGYGVQKKKELTGAVAQIKTEEMTKIVASDFTKSLQGQVAGVNVTESSGRPGEEANIQIRGLGSINGTSSPLYVVDGIPYNSNPNIASEDIATVDILKDGAAAAVYGTRASNGVILITTKRGKAGKTKVSLSSYYGIQNITSGTPLLNTPEHIYVDEMNQAAAGGVSNILFYNPDAMDYNTDFVDRITNNNASIQNHSITMSGGKEDVTFNVNANYFEQDGVLIQSGYERFNTRANANMKKGRFEAFVSLGLMHSEKEVEPYSLYEFAIFQGPYRPPLADYETTENTVVIPGNNPDHVSFLSKLLTQDDIRKEDSYNFATNLKFELMDGLSLQSNLGYNYWAYQRSFWQPQYLVYDVEGNPNELGSRNEAVLEETYTTSRKTTMEFLLNYSKTFGKHSVGAIAGYTREETNYKNTIARKVDWVSNTVPVFDGGKTPTATNGTENTQGIVGKLLRVQYNYDEKYLFSASVRHDGSSNFGNDHRYATFPGVSAGWNISEEGFMDNLESVQNLKLRASYGEVGNQGIPPYLYAAYVDANIDYPWAAETSSDHNLGAGAIQRGYANPDVQWETNLSRNIGVDLLMFKGKFNFTADLYQNDKRNMLLQVPIPLSTGTTVPNDWNSSYSTRMVNVGNMTNKGVELSSYYKSRTKSGLNWQITGTFTKNINEITDLGSDLDEIPLGDSKPGTWRATVQDVTTYMRPGYEAGAFFLIPTDGIFQTQAELEAHSVDGNPIQPNAQLGDLKYVDVNGDGVIDDNDRTYQGSGMPVFEAGLIANLDYKGFDFSMQLYYSHGNKVYNGSKLFAYSNNRHKDLYYMWTPANTNSDIMAARTSDTHDNFRTRSDYWLEDGSFLRLRNLSFGYTLPKSVFNGNIDKLRFYITAQNPLTFTKYEGYDPEIGGNGVSNRGIDKGNYPVSRKFLMGVQIDF